MVDMKFLEAMRKLDEGLIMINLKNKTVFKKEGEQILAKRYKDDDFLSEYKDEWRKVSYIETDGEWIEALKEDYLLEHFNELFNESKKHNIFSQLELTVIDSSIQNAISRRFK
ncbi:hypothetical protein [Turicibacter sanguinis]|uniref:hypothetical protein n=1 Tax=Turicibacter sanguinis TaxID=154288 RepID=UPI0018AC2527|nr:hypothetical protein [Turicibacter sanguinis]MDB8553905.1 hypothetical protein [Turicibacter sanguinis]